MRVVGIDPSLTGCGVSVLEIGKPPRVGVVRSKPQGISVADRLARLEEHVNHVLEFIDGEPDITLSVIETPAYGSVQGSQHDRSGFWWLLVQHLSALGNVVEVPPTVVKKFATGKGNSDKDEMVWVTAKEFPDITEVLGNDAVDALWLSTMGQYHLDPDFAGVRQTKIRDAAAKAVHW